jgi:hypothetical protein
MISKISRLAVLKSRHAALFGVAMSGFFSVSASEIQKETKEKRCRGRVESAETPSDDSESDAFRSQLHFDRASDASPSETAILLSRDDRKILASELGRKPRTVIFSPSQIALREHVAQFREDVSNLPLLLLP